MNKKTYTGRCLCGSVRFSVSVSAGRVKSHTCSCNMCQKHSGSLTLCWLEFSKDKVNWIGDGGEPSLYRASDYSSRAFCSQCGSTLGAIDDGQTVGLLLGSFDVKSGIELIPRSHSFADKRPEWWKITCTI